MAAARDRVLQAALQHFADTGEKTISVSDLSRVAGTARGTIYNNFADIDELFTLVSAQVCDEFEAAAQLILQSVTDEREALGCLVGLFLKRAHELPPQGRFLVRFAPYVGSIRNIWSNLPLAVVRRAIVQQRLALSKAETTYYMQLVAGATYGFMILVVEGHKSWREAVETLVMMVLSAGGIAQVEARSVAQSVLVRLTAPGV